MYVLFDLLTTFLPMTAEPLLQSYTSLRHHASFKKDLLNRFCFAQAFREFDSKEIDYEKCRFAYFPMLYDGM